MPLDKAMKCVDGAMVHAAGVTHPYSMVPVRPVEEWVEWKCCLDSVCSAPLLAEYDMPLPEPSFATSVFIGALILKGIWKWTLKS